MALLFIFIKEIRKMTTSLGSTVRSSPWHHCLFHVWLQGANVEVEQLPEIWDWNERRGVPSTDHDSIA